MISLVTQSPSPLPEMGFGNLLQMGQESLEQHLARLFCTREYLLIPTAQEAGILFWNSRVSVKQFTTLGSSFPLPKTQSWGPLDPPGLLHQHLCVTCGCPHCLGLPSSSGLSSDTLQCSNLILMSLRTSHHPLLPTAALSLDVWRRCLCQTEGYKTVRVWLEREPQLRVGCLWKTH